MRKKSDLTRKSLQKIKRSKTKPCDVCEEKKILEEHHIHGRKITDANAKWNLCYICSDCHTEVHQDLIIIEGWQQTTLGPELIWYRNDVKI